MSTSRQGIYTRYRLCPDLSPKQKCIRVQRYKEGRSEEVFHEHIPSHRLSQASEVEALRALASHYAAWPAIFILHSYLNGRKAGPQRYPGFTNHVEYPEEGVIRRYFGAHGVTAWSDTVVTASDFRRQRVVKRKPRRQKRNDA